MSFNFEVCKVGDDSYRVSGTTGQGSSRNTTQTFTQTYLVKTLDPDGDLYTGNPSEINTAIVGQAEGLPTVQKSIYYDSDSGLIHPYAVCTSKDVKRRREAPMVFDVTCSFSAKLETESLSNQIVKDPTDIAPEVTVSLSGKDRVLYQDFGSNEESRTAPAGVEQSWMFEGIDLQYPSPVVTQIPLLTLTISQYENYVSFNDIMNRSFKLNETQWQGQPAGFWRLAVKNVSEVDIQTQSGKVNWAKVTYEAILSNDGYYTQAGVWEKTGWEAQIPLIAPKYVAGVPFAAGTVLKFVGTNSEPKMGFINADGTDDAAATRPKYKFHNRSETIEFSEYLQDF
jgi:hypothetical protein